MLLVPHNATRGIEYLVPWAETARGLGASQAAQTPSAGDCHVRGLHARVVTHHRACMRALTTLESCQTHTYTQVIVSAIATHRPAKVKILNSGSEEI